MEQRHDSWMGNARTFLSWLHGYQDRRLGEKREKMSFFLQDPIPLARKLRQETNDLGNLGSTPNAAATQPESLAEEAGGGSFPAWAFGGILGKHTHAKATLESGFAARKPFAS
ncbi:hypothetical protein MAMC_00980 [Methylacidimicrobium cyclopophantes]|uniref:Uncharacterized protein n=1 Tax=Methylacidimicrobium cyclopophantes TaxID=1041766 RepID=A0A5E6MCZ5_9BACT|nr:hypothetical protein MAMC_00980 [Methylacidimicrobium cyclopophantes]